jgi:pyruvate, orthophosphate dikinase
MIPLVGFRRELDLQAELVHRVAKEVMAEEGEAQLPGRHHDRNPARRAHGRRDRADRRVLQLRHQRPHPDLPGHEPRRLRQSFLPPYAELEICKTNPFASIDQTGVAELMKIAVEKGRSSRPDIKLGICGEHGGDPNSVKFCHKLGLTYVSCSPFRVPVARLAAAQAALEEEAAKAARKAKKK